MTANREASPPAPLTDYIMQFSATYVLCVLVVVLVAYVLNFNAPIAMGIIVLIAAMSPPIRSFVSDNRRVFDPRERTRFATGVALASLALNVAFAGAFSYVTTVILHQPSTLIDALEEASQQGISVNEVMSVAALIWLSGAWAAAYLFALFSARSWHRKLTGA
jgi:hypothetical protein